MRFDLGQPLLLISPCKQPMHPVANGHCGRSYLASSDFASAVWPGRLGQTFVKRVLLMHNQDCNTMQIHTLSYFSQLFFFFFHRIGKNLSELHSGSSRCTARLLVNQRGQPPRLQRETLKSRSRGNCLWLTTLKMRSQECLPTKSPFEMANPVLLVWRGLL